MRRRTMAFGSYCVVFVCLSHQAVAGGTLVTPLQTQSTSPAGVLVATNWAPGTTGITNPLVFNQFNPNLGTLTAIDITLTTNIRNDYTDRFQQAPGLTTIDRRHIEDHRPERACRPDEESAVDRWSDRHALWPQRRHAALRRTGDETTGRLCAADRIERHMFVDASASRIRITFRRRSRNKRSRARSPPQIRHSLFSEFTGRATSTSRHRDRLLKLLSRAAAMAAEPS